MRDYISVFLLAVLLGSCATTSDDPEPWREPDSYSFVLDSHCGDGIPLGSFEITVTSHVVTNAVALDELADEWLKTNGSDRIPTVDELVTEFMAAKENADNAVIEHAPIDGHPLAINIDMDKDVADDDVCYDISDYSVSK